MENIERERAIERFADDLMFECGSLDGAREINTEYDLYDGDLLPSMMVEIAGWKIAVWTGSSEDAIKRMTALINLLSDALQDIAEREVTK